MRTNLKKQIKFSDDGTLLYILEAVTFRMFIYKLTIPFNIDAVETPHHYIKLPQGAAFEEMFFTKDNLSVYLKIDGYEVKFDLLAAEVAL